MGGGGGGGGGGGVGGKSLPSVNCRNSGQVRTLSFLCQRREKKIRKGRKQKKAKDEKTNCSNNACYGKQFILQRRDKLQNP